jgi:FMN phosphatase YigB (HAD superfamily)
MEKFQDRFLEEVKEKFKEKGIKAILFDFDDTLIYTSELFKMYMDEFVLAVCEETGLSFEKVGGDLRRINDEKFKTMGVNPVRWKEVVEEMIGVDSGYGESPMNNLNVLMKIYYTDPRIREGAEAVLEIVKRAGIKMALVTHANVDWTERKLLSSGIADYFETIKIVDENRHKSAEDWMEAVWSMDVRPEDCLVLGDSLPGDIIAADSIGAKTMWLHNGSTWSVYRNGSVPERTIHLDNINELLSALDRLG